MACLTLNTAPYGLRDLLQSSIETTFILYLYFWLVPVLVSVLVLVLASILVQVAIQCPFGEIASITVLLYWAHVISNIS